MFKHDSKEEYMDVLESVWEYARGLDCFGSAWGCFIICRSALSTIGVAFRSSVQGNPGYVCTNVRSPA